MCFLVNRYHHSSIGSDFAMASGETPALNWAATEATLVLGTWKKPSDPTEVKTIRSPHRFDSSILAAQNDPSNSWYAIR